MQKAKHTKGYVLVTTLVFASISVIIISGILVWFTGLVKSGRLVTQREQAFHIAEAGIDYYRWHLAHAPSDYQDGTATSGPYVHPFHDKDGNLIGQFSLNITPPIPGSTIVTIQSTGTIHATSSISRTITTKLAIPSFAKYAVVMNDNVRFGEGTEIFGPIHSNNGIRFDGLAHNLVTSALATYNDPDHTGNNEFGVHTHVSAPPASGINEAFRPTEASPYTVSQRNDVFLAGRQMPVVAVDFSGITADLAQMKADAQTSSGRYFAGSGTGFVGYQIILKTNDTFDLYKVSSSVAAPSNCSNIQSQTGWGTWSIQNKTFVANYNFPANGVIFVEDHVWVEGQINTARLTIAAGRFPDSPAQRRSIIVNNDLLYTNYNGTDVLALIAQDNINVGMVSDTNLRIDAALMAQNGRIGRYYYSPNANWPSGGGQTRCSPYHTRNSLTLYGMLGSNGRYGFGYTDDSGYITRTITYDANLLYGPPPSFPLTSDQYQTILWEENE
jgi:hypothetical protein